MTAVDLTVDASRTVDAAACPIERLTFYNDSHAYYVKLVGERNVRWSGASSYGKQIESTDALTRWKVCSVLSGAAGDPTLLRRFALATSRDEQDHLIEALLTAAKANQGRDFGSDAHRVTELHDLGRLTVDDEWTRAITQRWGSALDAASVTVDPSYVERIVIVPEMKVCATYDRLARYADELHVLDLKTGDKGVSYPHTMCVQLALIANASWMTSGPGERKGDSTTWATFEPTPPVNRQRGLIVSMPIDSPQAEVWALDIEAGWEAARLARSAKRWSATKPATLLATSNITPTAQPPEGDPFQGLPQAPESSLPPAPDELRAWVVDRVRAIIDAGHADTLTRAWPDGVPGLKAKGHTVGQLDAIVAACVAVEGEHRMAFGEPDPRTAPPERVVAEPVVAPEPIDEGEEVSPEEIAALRVVLDGLPGYQRELVAVCARLAHDARTPIGLVNCPRRRRYEIAAALIAQATGAPDHADAGVALGRMTVEQARSLAALGALTDNDTQKAG